MKAKLYKYISEWLSKIFYKHFFVSFGIYVKVLLLLLLLSLYIYIPVAYNLLNSFSDFSWYVYLMHLVIVFFVVVVVVVVYIIISSEENRVRFNTWTRLKKIIQYEIHTYFFPSYLNTTFCFVQHWQKCIENKLQLKHSTLMLRSTYMLIR